MLCMDSKNWSPSDEDCVIRNNIHLAVLVEFAFKARIIGNGFQCEFQMVYQHYL